MLLESMSLKQQNGNLFLLISLLSNRISSEIETS